MEDNLYKPICSKLPNWRIEDGSENIEEGAHDIYHAPVIENQDKDILWYSQYFVSQEHINFICRDEKMTPYILSIKIENSTTNPFFRVILWLDDGPERKILHVKDNLHKSKPSIYAMEILKALKPSLSKKRVKEIKSQILEEELLQLEEKTIKKKFKFGVLYMKNGQLTEEEMFNNRKGSPSFNRFLDLLGEKVQLKNWNKYSGGLDVKSNSSGESSIYLEYCGYEIMYHISTMLPYTKNDPQQIDRKKHIGNDISIIIFQDPGTKNLWSPSIISSKFPHIYAVVRPTKQGSYRVSFSIKETVNRFGPPLPHPPIFDDPILFRNFLITKLINGERETIRSSPDFKHNETFKFFLTLIHERLSKSNITKTPSPRRQRQSLISSSIQAFQVRKVLNKMDSKITCSDSWNNNMVIGTTDGLYLYKINGKKDLEEGKVTKILTQPKKYNHYSQINVLLNIGIIVTLIQKVGIVLYDIETLNNQVEGPAEFIVELTKYVKFYSLGAVNNILYLCCAIKSGILLFIWRNDQFLPYQKIELPETPNVLEFDTDGKIIVGYQGTYAHIIIEDTNDPIFIPFYTWKDHSNLPVDIIFLEEDEYLLCFSNIGIFINKDGDRTKPYSINWNSVPNAFVNVYPYLLVFTSLNIEVRFISNGSLVQTIENQNQPFVTFLTTNEGIFYSCYSDDTKSSIHQMKLVAHQSPTTKLQRSISPVIKNRRQSTPIYIIDPVTGKHKKKHLSIQLENPTFCLIPSKSDSHIHLDSSDEKDIYPFIKKARTKKKRTKSTIRNSEPTISR